MKDCGGAVNYIYINGNNNDIDCDPALAIKTLKNEFIKCVNKVIEEKKIKRIVISLLQ